MQHWSPKKAVGHHGPTGLSKEPDHLAAELIGSKGLVSLGSGYGESHSRANGGMGKGKGHDLRWETSIWLVCSMDQRASNASDHIHHLSSMYHTYMSSPSTAA